MPEKVNMDLKSCLIFSFSVALSRKGLAFTNFYNGAFPVTHCTEQRRATDGKPSSAA